MNCPRCGKAKPRFDVGVCYRCVLKGVKEAEEIYRRVKLKQEKEGKG